MSDKNIPLSELIRIGSKVTKQCFIGLFNKTTNSTCAIGAAYVAKHGGMPSKPISTNDAVRECGIDPTELFRNPETGVPMFLSSVIVELNDLHRWTRERISDWLKSKGM